MSKAIRTTAIATVIATAMAAAAMGAEGGMTDQQIERAVSTGLKSKGRSQGLVLRDTAQGWASALSAMDTKSSSTASSGFWVEVFTPLTWVQQQASNAAKEYRTMSAADVGPELREPVLRVIVHPDMPNTVSSQGMKGTSSVRHVVLRDESRKVVIQPTKKEPFTEDAQNAMGAKVQFTGLQATFSMDDLREIHGKDKEFFVTVIGESGEEKNFKIKKKHFAELVLE